MTGHPRKLVTIVAEGALEGHIIEEISKFPVSGYTITDARGTGSRGRRFADTSDTGNIRCEVVCKDEVAGLLVEQLLARYGRDYALVAYVSDVYVMRADKF
jgi:hypothetical protein